jgi:hypothetical protein
LLRSELSTNGMALHSSHQVAALPSLR